MNPKFVRSIENAYRLALILGVFNYSYDRSRNNFKERTILSTYHRCCVWIVRILSLSMVWAYCMMLPGYKFWQDTARIQDRFLWFINIVQLYLGVLLTYTNHSLNQSHLLRMLNRIVKCNSDLARLLGKDGERLRSFYFRKRIRIVMGIVDILTTWFRPIVFQLITFEWKTLAVVNKVVLMSSFLGQHYVQTFIGCSFHQMECFVRTGNGSSLSAEQYRRLAKICTQLHKISVSSNAYHGAFGLISYLSLIRTICFFSSCFSALFTAGIMRVDLLATLTTYLFWMVAPGLVLLIDVTLLGVAADDVNRSVKGFYFGVYLMEHESAVSTEVCQAIDIILQKQHLENMQTRITSGEILDRSFAFRATIEALSWVTAFFVYSGGRLSTAAMAMITVGFKMRLYVYLVLICACSMCALLYGLYKVAVYLKKVYRRINISWCGEECNSI